MWFAEYWDDFDEVYVSGAFNDEQDCRDWCFEHQLASYEDDDGREYFV